MNIEYTVTFDDDTIFKDVKLPSSSPLNYMTDEQIKGIMIDLELGDIKIVREPPGPAPTAEEWYK